MSKRIKIAIGLYLLVALAAVVVLAVTVVPGGSSGDRHHSSTERRYIWVDTRDVAIGGPLAACKNANASLKVQDKYDLRLTNSPPYSLLPFQNQHPVEFFQDGNKRVLAKCEVRDGAQAIGAFREDRQ